ncbi:hypothetical protein Hanom_Chr06g00547731 [Helianthus anomalus]
MILQTVNTHVTSHNTLLHRGTGYSGLAISPIRPGTVELVLFIRKQVNIKNNHLLEAAY